MRLLAGLVGVALVVSTLNFAAANAAVEVRCAPHLLPDCESVLKMRLERGYVPNRCVPPS